MNFCFALSRLLISSISLSSVLMATRSSLLRRCCPSIIEPYSRNAANAVTPAASAATPSATRNASLRSLRCASRQGRRFIRGMSVETPQCETAGGEQCRGITLHRLRLGARGQLHLAERVALLGGNPHAAGNHLGNARDVGAAAAHHNLLGLLASGTGSEIELQ